MTTPAEHATAIIAWVGGRDAAAIDAELADPAHPICAAIAAIADAADSDDESLRSAGLTALFAGVVEPLNDSFTPAGRAAYARLFARACWRVISRRPEMLAALAGLGVDSLAALEARYRRVRAGADPLPASVRRIVVLSRVTVGADVLLTTVAIQRLHQRWPAAELVLLGDPKLAALLGGGAGSGSGAAAFPPIRVKPISYRRRGGFGERLASWLPLLAAVAEEQPDLVVGPDSRLDQLGLLPVVADPARYLLWENTQPEAAQAQSLAELCDRAFARRLGLPGSPACLPRAALDAGMRALAERFRAAFAGKPVLAVKLDHGGNPAKALPRAGEVAVLSAARAAGWHILIDRGFGDAELANSDALMQALAWSPLDLDEDARIGRDPRLLAAGELSAAPVVRFHGSIAGWAAALSACPRALSYDSVGHHLAAALGVPVAVAFTGHADHAFVLGWQPRGSAEVALVEIPTAEKQQPAWWERVNAAIGRPAAKR